jgi:hypothetical protein
MNSNKHWLFFNLVLGETGILFLYLIILLMMYTKHFVNIVFFLPHVFVYVFFLNIGYFILVKGQKYIKTYFGWTYDIKNLYTWLCIGLNLLLGIYMIFEFSLFKNGHSSY